MKDELLAFLAAHNIPHDIQGGPNSSKIIYVLQRAMARFEFDFNDKLVSLSIRPE